MTTRRKFKSDAFEAIHASAQALQKVGAIDKATMREFDETCLMVMQKALPAVALSRAFSRHSRVCGKDC